MSRPTQLLIDPDALVHNVSRIRQFAPGKSIIAMVKANAYGCGLSKVIPFLDGRVDAFGVACIEEALEIRSMGAQTPCILFQGIFSLDELILASEHEFSCVIHQSQQLEWLLNTPLPKSFAVWVKVNTGMNRLGFKPQELGTIMDALQTCPWVNKKIDVMTHFACADEPERIENAQQISLFESTDSLGFHRRSMANSAAIISFPQAHYDVVRPGIMLYGVSPFANSTSFDLDLRPVMRFISAVTAIHQNPPFSAVGYGGTWSSPKPSVIGIIAAGYGDGYPRHIAENTPVWVCGREVPIVGRVSMDMIAVDLTQHPKVQVGDPVELWGEHILVERIAKAAGTIGYELLCQMTARSRSN